MEENNRLGVTPLPKLMLQMAVPAVVAQIINVLYNIVDRIYIGHIQGVGSAALTGVGVTFPIITMITAFSNIVGSGGAPLSAIWMGKGDKEYAGKIMGTGVAMLLFFAACLMAVFYIFKVPFLYLFGASDATIGYGNSYLSIYLGGTVFVLLALGLNPYIIAQGKPKAAMGSVLLGAAVAIVAAVVPVILVSRAIFRTGALLPALRGAVVGGTGGALLRLGSLLLCGRGFGRLRTLGGSLGYLRFGLFRFGGGGSFRLGRLGLRGSFCFWSLRLGRFGLHGLRLGRFGRRLRLGSGLSVPGGEIGVKTRNLVLLGVVFKDDV